MPFCWRVGDLTRTMGAAPQAPRAPSEALQAALARLEELVVQALLAQEDFLARLTILEPPVPQAIQVISVKLAQPVIQERQV